MPTRPFFLFRSLQPLMLHIKVSFSETDVGLKPAICPLKLDDQHLEANS